MHGYTAVFEAESQIVFFQTDGFRKADLLIDVIHNGCFFRIIDTELSLSGNLPRLLKSQLYAFIFLRPKSFGLKPSALLLEKTKTQCPV
jgi:hypothetical protein